MKHLGRKVVFKAAQFDHEDEQGKVYTRNIAAHEATISAVRMIDRRIAPDSLEFTLKLNDGTKFYLSQHELDVNTEAV